MSDVETFSATVVRVARVTPMITRVTFQVPGFVSTGCPDEWFGIFFGEPGDHSQRRTYTVRAVRPERDEVDVDVVLHDGGIGWAKEVTVGDRFEWWAQIGSAYELPDDAQWQLLVGDLAALPAIGRIVEELPAGARAIVVAEVPQPADRQEWETAGDVEVRWLQSGPRSQLEEAVRAFEEPEGEGYYWMGGETRTVRATRRYLRHERGLPRERYAVTGYWLGDVDPETWMARYEPVASELDAIWEDGEARGRDVEEIMDDYEQALERVGL